MGVKETAPRRTSPWGSPEPTWRERLGWGRVPVRPGSLFAMARQPLHTDRRVTTSNRRWRALAGTIATFADRRPDELVALYRALEPPLLTWDAPLSTTSSPWSSSACSTPASGWCGDDAATRQNELIGGEGGMVSAEPAIRFSVSRAAPHRTRRSSSAEQRDPPETWRRAGRRPGSPAPSSSDYLERFGDRCLEELKLESDTLFDDPTPLFRSVGHLARRPDPGPAPRSRGISARARAGGTRGGVFGER